MNSIKVKIAGTILIVSSLILLFGSISLITMEYLRISEYLVNEWEIKRSYSNQLIDDEYYNNENIQADPYLSLIHI